MKNILDKPESDAIPNDPDRWNDKQKDVLRLIEESRMTDKTSIKRMATAITINGHIFARFGDFSLVTGQRKAGKTLVLQSAVATAFIRDEDRGIEDTLQIRTAFAHGKAVVYADTEGSMEDTQDFIEGVKRILGVDEMPPNFFVYHWREMTQKQCREALEILFLIHSDMHLCVIDGIADIVSKPNDEGESNETVRFIMKSAGQSNACILCVIHENPAKNNQDTKSRGHLGSELERKASGAIAVEKNREEKKHYIKSRFLRKSEDFDPIMFWFENGHPVSRVLTFEEKAKLADKNYNKLHDLQVLCRQCFLGVESKTEPELKASVELYQTASPSKDAHRKKRERLMTDLLKHNLIRLDDSTGPRLYFPVI